MTPEQSADEQAAVATSRERERAAPARSGGERRRGGFLQKSHRRPSHQLAASSVATIVAVVAAIAGFSQSTAEFLCTTVQRTKGAHVARGSALVIVAGLLVLIAGIITRNRPRLFAAVLLVEVAALTSGLVFVARDAARTRVVEDCGFFTETTTARAGQVAYLYIIWAAAALILLWQAARGLRTTLSLRFAGSVLSALAVGVGLGLVPDGHHRRGSGGVAASLPPKGVLICRDAFQAPEVFGGWQCENNTDIGAAPLLHAPKSVLCSADLHARIGDRISVQAFYFKMLLKHDDFKNSDVNPNAYVEIDPGDMSSVDNRLPDGSYRCRFYVNHKLVHARRFQIGPTRYQVSPALSRYHYTLTLTTLHGRPRPNASTHVGDEFAIDVSSPRLPANAAIPVSVCVNTPDGDSCYDEYILHGQQTRVDWQVDKREGVRGIYRLMIETSDRTVATRSLRLRKTQR